MHLMTAFIYRDSCKVLLVDCILQLELVQNYLVPVCEWLLLFLDVLLTICVATRGSSS